jgi:hypothetical protein
MTRRRAPVVRWITPAEQKRFLRMCQELMSSGLTNRDLAIEIGYSNVNSLSTALRRVQYGEGGPGWHAFNQIKKLHKAWMEEAKEEKEEEVEVWDTDESGDIVLLDTSQPAPDEEGEDEEEDERVGFTPDEERAMALANGTPGWMHDYDTMVHIVMDAVQDLELAVARVPKLYRGTQMLKFLFTLSNACDQYGEPAEEE